MLTRWILCAALVMPALMVPLGAAADDAHRHLQLAEEHRDSFRLDEALAHYRLALAGAASPAAERSFAEYLLALGLFDQAGEVLQEAAASYPEDPVLLELQAVLAAGREQHHQAVDWLRRAVAAGREPLAWIARGRLRQLAAQPPYRGLLDPGQLLAALVAAERPRQGELLELLAQVMPPDLAPAMVAFLTTGAGGDQELLRLGLRALARSEVLLTRPDLVEELLCADQPRLRRQTLLELWRQGDPRFLPPLLAAQAGETDPGNADLIAVLVAVLRATEEETGRAEVLLAGVPEANTFRHLALYALAARLELAGEGERAEQTRLTAASLHPELAAVAAKHGASPQLAEYWECRDRADQRQMRALLEHHQRVAPIDARIYGLPEHDFDDQKLLTIPERLFLREHARHSGKQLPTSGPVQYPREVRHFLRKVQQSTGSFIDCSGHLSPLADEPVGRALSRDGSEVKLEENAAPDNEVNIVVNPYDPRFVVATSNPTGYTGNKVYRSADWGKTWTSGTASVADNCCDPVSYYTRTLVGGVQTDVLYHSTLVGYDTIKSHMLYSTDNGATWSDCGSDIGGAGDRDRQDHAVDSNPDSACYNTIYLAHHDGIQYVAASTGTTFPYCQSWHEQSSGINDTIGSAIVISDNGLAHNFFTQYDGPGGLYHTMTNNCGNSWSAAQRLVGINNPGTFEWGIPSACQRQVYRYPQADTDRQASSALRNNIYVVWGDLSGSCSAPGCNGNTSCNNDVFLAVGVPDNRSNPASWAWTTQNLTDPLSDDYSDEFYPSLSVDQADGSVYISYYRSDSGAPGGAANIGPRKTQVHYVMLRSIDGGQSWQGPLQITSSPSDESGSGANADMQWGDYVWNDVVDGVAYGAWTDRREGADEDIWAAKICSEPSHWSERAPTFAAPATAAAATGGNSYTVSWSAPDLYWGDGGESPSSRRYQLWVDGALAQDGIAWTATSTSWTTPDSLQHNLHVRAINRCGVTKDYAPVVIGSGGGGNTPPQVTITAPTDGASVEEGTAVTLSGTASDAADGDLTASLVWSSSVDGTLGSGGTLVRILSVATHQITASVTDSGGLAGSASVTVTVTPAGNGGNALEESFETGLGSWSAGGLWHLKSNSGCASPGYSSAVTAVHYGADATCSYDTGSRTAGNLVSPEVSGLSADSTLSFQYYRQVEYEPSLSADSTEVAVAVAGSSSWSTVWARDSANASENTWTSSGAISLAAWAGQTIRLRFRFDSVDEFENGYTGWFIDDVVVTGDGCPGGEPALFSDGFETGDTTAWSATQSLPRDPTVP